jgi:allantoinase
MDNRDRGLAPVRDLTGYGRSRPDPKWPGSARLALSIVLAYEEGGESTPCNGDDRGETFLLETFPLVAAPAGERLLLSESQYEYGSRVGIWRLFRLLNERNLTATVLAVGRAVELNPQPVEAMAAAGFEIACHQYRYVSYQQTPEETERKHIRMGIAAIQNATGKRPVGFYHWSGPNSRRLGAEAGFIYDTAEYNDELPYWTQISGKPHLIIPYMLDNNDFRYSHASGFSTSDDFFNYNKATFDQLYEESARTPTMMTLAFHPRLSGHPGRARAAARLLGYIASHAGVWVCTRQQIAEHWLKTHPSPLQKDTDT